MGQPVIHFEVIGKDGDKLRTDPEGHAIGVVKPEAQG